MSLYFHFSNHQLAQTKPFVHRVRCENMLAAHAALTC